jgi:hypothetical protein
MAIYDLEELDYDLTKRHVNSGLRRIYLSLKQLGVIENTHAVYARNFYNNNENKEFFLFCNNKIIQVSTKEGMEVSLKTLFNKVRTLELVESNIVSKGISLKIILEDSTVIEFSSLIDSNYDYNDEYVETLKELYTYYLLNN